MDKFLNRQKAEIVGVFEEVSARLELQPHIEMTPKIQTTLLGGKICTW